MVRAFAECLLVLALLVIGQGRTSAQDRVYVVVRDPVTAASVATSVLQAGRVELEALVGARPGTVVATGSPAAGLPPSYARLRAYVVQPRILSVSASATSARIVIDIDVTDLSTGRTIVSARNATDGPVGMAVGELFNRALRGLWGSIAPQLPS